MPASRARHAPSLSLDDGLAQAAKARDVQRDVVVDEEDRARAAGVGVPDVCDDAFDRPCVKVAAAHFDDRAETAVVRAAARRLHDVDRPAEHGVAGQYARGPIRQPDVRQIADVTRGVADPAVTGAKGQAGDRGKSVAPCVVRGAWCEVRGCKVRGCGVR